MKKKPVPLLGILTVRDEHQRFRGNKLYFQHLCQRAALEGEEAVVIPLDQSASFSGRSSLVNGWRYDRRENNWRPDSFPLPSVLYNRIPSRESESSPAVRQTLAALRNQKNIPLFNPHYFNKWQLYCWMKFAGIPGVSVPYTTRLQAPEDGLRAMRRFPELILKPESGKAGIGIGKTAADGIRLQTVDGIKRIALRGNWAEAWHTLWPALNGSRYVVQQAIPLAQTDGRPFDLRILVQKTASGRWAVSGTGVRVAGQHALTTHVPRGGTVGSLETIMNQTFSAAHAGEIRGRLHRAAVLTAAHLAASAGHLWGEMSMDWGLDPQGTLWFFEANAKPMIFDEPAIFRRSLRRIIGFARYLREKNR